MITLKVIPDDGDEYSLKANARDVLVWEKANRGRSFTQLINDPFLHDLYKIAHISSRRQQLFTGTLEEFEKTCEVRFDREEQEPEPDPT